MPVFKNSFASVINRLPRPAILLLCLLALSLGLGACRTSQQESRRSASRTTAAGGQATMARQMDSLLIIEQKLIEVIDSMTTLVDADHQRIRALEQQVDELRNRGYGYSSTPVPPPDAPSYNSYAAPPPVPESRPLTAPMTMQDRYGDALRLYNANQYSPA